MNTAKRTVEQTRGRGRLFAAVCVALLALGGCFGKTETQDSGNTNWVECDHDSDCGGLVCQCRVCMRLCTGRLDCSLPPEQACTAGDAETPPRSHADAARDTEPDASSVPERDAAEPPPDGASGDGGDSDVHAPPRDVTPPTFYGARRASVDPGTPTVVDLTWEAAVDDVSPSGAIVYEIFMATKSHSEDFSGTPIFTPQGVTEWHVDGLARGSVYYFVIRARDEAGNRDKNILQVQATTPVR